MGCQNDDEMRLSQGSEGAGFSQRSSRSGRRGPSNNLDRNVAASSTGDFMVSRTRLVLIEILYKYRAATSGNIFGTGTTTFVELEVPQFRNLLPFATELTLFTLGEDMTPLFNWGIFFGSGYRRSFEPAAPFQIGSTVTGPGTVSNRHGSYSTIANFNLDSRLLLGLGNASGGTFQGGVCSATLGVLTVGM